MDIFYKHFGIKKYNILSKKKSIDKIFNKNKILQYQFERIKSLLIFSYKNSIFYKNRFDHVNFNPYQFKSLEDLSHIPILKRQDINLNLENIHIKNKSSKINFSGGSGGNPVKFYQDKEYWEWGELSRIWTYNICNIEQRNKLILWGSNFDWYSPDSLRGRFINFLKKQIFVNAFGTNEKEFLDQIILAKNKNYKHLLGYASFINYFTNVVKKNNIDFNLKTIQVTGENLLPSYRKNIESIFGKIVYDRYGSREVSIIASTSKKNYSKFEECSFHNYIETIQNSVYGNKIVVTNLNNFCFPFIRYEIGDYSSKKIYTNNLSVIDEIYGRDYGTFKSPSGRMINGIIFPHKLGQFKGIEDFQIKVFKNNIIISIVPDKNYTEETRKNIIDLVINKMDSKFKLEIKIVQRINEYLLSGKRKILSINE